MDNLTEGPDGLPAAIVGEWVKEKHSRLRKYVDISRAVRRKFNGWALQTSYIDLYCNYGCSQIRETGEFVDGSPFVAFDQAESSETQFSDIFLNDKDDEACRAMKQRFFNRGREVQLTNLSAESAVDEIVSALDPKGLHFAFLDPYNFDSLPFSVIESLVRLERMDLIIHASRMDLMRNFGNYLNRSDSPLDRFAPGWRNAIDYNSGVERNRITVFEHWLKLIQGLGTNTANGVELVTGTRNQGLYWLVFVSRNELALKFWDEIRNVGKQGDLF